MQSVVPVFVNVICASCWPIDGSPSGPAARVRLALLHGASPAGALLAGAGGIVVVDAGDPVGDEDVPKFVTLTPHLVSNAVVNGAMVPFERPRTIALHVCVASSGSHTPGCPPPTQTTAVPPTGRGPVSGGGVPK